MKKKILIVTGVALFVLAFININLVLSTNDKANTAFSLLATQTASAEGSGIYMIVSWDSDLITTTYGNCMTISGTHHVNCISGGTESCTPGSYPISTTICK